MRICRSLEDSLQTDDSGYACRTRLGLRQLIEDIGQQDNKFDTILVHAASRRNRDETRGEHREIVQEERDE